MTSLPKSVADADVAARCIVDETGGEIRLALPLGIGKANTVVNALTEMAIADRSIKLDIFTALTLERPEPASEMQRRFLGPAADRLFGNYPALDYAARLRAGTLPDNITVQEFFFQAGNWLSVAPAQQNYITANYTHALDYLLIRKPNVIAQLLARDGDQYSLSCNTDITVDLLRARRDGDQDFMLIGEVNNDLPFMPGSGEIAASEVQLLLDDPAGRFELFSIPKRPVTLEDHAIGLHVAGLVPDGGTLQIGIGSVGDAVASALLLRHRRTRILSEIYEQSPFPLQIEAQGPFETGLYGVTEMLVQGMVELFQGGVIRREIDDIAIHAGFFADCRDFYRSLREMPAPERAKIAMMPVSYTNQLYGDEAGKRTARRDARFVNSAMKVTLLGGVVSDMTSDGRIVSGVGGQFNFVDQAFALNDARAILTLPSTRISKGKVTSNIVWDHPHETIPRHLRDIVVTEYGVADVRGRSDAEAIIAIVAIADSRFQPGLMNQAKEAGKLPGDAALAPRHQNNTPADLKSWLCPFHHAGDLATFPFGTDFSEIEQRLLPALAVLKSAEGSKCRMATLLWRGLTSGSFGPVETECLERLELRHPRTPGEWLMALALRGAIREV